MLARTWILSFGLSCVIASNYFQNFEETRLSNTPDCPDPEPVANAYRWSMPSGVEYQCVEGYNRTGGDTNLICSANAWSGSPPVCELNCGKPPVTPSTNLNDVTNDGLTTLSGGEAKASYQCLAGLNTSNPYPTISCQAQMGSWQTPRVYCFYPSSFSVELPKPEFAPSSSTESTTANSTLFSNSTLHTTTDSSLNISDSNLTSGQNSKSTLTSSESTSKSETVSSTTNPNSMKTNQANTTDMYFNVTSQTTEVYSNMTPDSSSTSTQTVSTPSPFSKSTVSDSRLAELNRDCLLLDAKPNPQHRIFTMENGTRELEIVDFYLHMQTIEKWEECVGFSDAFDVHGVSYDGSIAFTQKGTQCQSWADSTPHVHSYNNLTITQFPDSSFSDVKNYCRNPRHNGEYRSRPWCFTTNSSQVWDYCDIPDCPVFNVKVSVINGTTERSCDFVAFYNADTSQPRRLQCPQLPTAPFGTDVEFSFSSTVQRTLYLCAIVPYGLDYEPGCGEPPHQRGWEMLYVDGHALDDEAEYKCAKGYHHLQGTGTAKCMNTRSWLGPTLTCTDEDNLAKSNSAIIPVFQDNDVGTCTQPMATMTETIDVFINNLVEVHMVSLVTNGSQPDSFTVIAELPNGNTLQCREQLETPYGYLVTCVGYPITKKLQVTLVVTESLSLCEVKVFGRNSSEELECRQTSSGVDYKGKLNMTEHGLPCIRWDHDRVWNKTDYIFPDGNISDADNYCRNPVLQSSGEPHNNYRPLCFYKTGIVVGYQFCSLFFCDKGCRTKKMATDYIGNIDHAGTESNSGNKCASWNTGKCLFRRSSDFAGDKANTRYCRNPGGSQERPWCYTDTSAKTYSYCDIPVCPTRSRLSTIELDLENQTDIDLLQNLSPKIRECLSATTAYGSPVFEGIINQLCGSSTTTYSQIMCHYADADGTGDYGEDTQWLLIEITCPPEEGTTASNFVSTHSPINETNSFSYEMSTLSTALYNPFNVTQGHQVCPATCSVICYNRTAPPISDEEIQESVDEIKRKLLIDKSLLSKTIRSKTSAPDSRPSSQVSGSLAVGILLVVFAFLISGDVITVVYFFYTILKPDTPKTEGF